MEKREFFEFVTNLDGKPVSALAPMEGQTDFGRYMIVLPENMGKGGWTRMSIRLPQIAAAFPPDLFNNLARRAALEHVVADALRKKTADYPAIRIADCGSQIVPRNSVAITSETVYANVEIFLGEPGEPLSGPNLRQMFSIDVPDVVNAGLFYCNLNEGKTEASVVSMQRMVLARQGLKDHGLVAFVGGGSRLSPARHASLGIGHTTLSELKLGSGDSMQGLGIPIGLTVIIGDGYSGRRELMASLADGIYNHLHDDPREYVVTSQEAVAIHAEPGRPVQRVDIRPFVQSLPDGSDPARFSTDAADSLTSMAASTMEAIESGARVLLFDESTADLEFLAGSSDGFPPAPNLTSLRNQIPSLVREAGVSVVVAGSGNAVLGFVPFADKVYLVSNFQVQDATEPAKQRIPQPELPAPTVPVHQIANQQRWIVPYSIDPSHAGTDINIDVTEPGILEFGSTTIDARRIPQITDAGQLETIGIVLAYARTYLLSEGRPMSDLLDAVENALSATDGIGNLLGRTNGRLTRPRRHEVAAVLNRLSSVRFSHTG